jgi:hypothetical protein
MDGTPHDCRNQAQETRKEESIVAVNQQTLGPLTIEEIDKRLRKVEAFLFLAGVKK